MKRSLRRAAPAVLVVLASLPWAASAEVSEAARQAFVKGTTVAKQAKNADQQLIAVKHFEEAVKLAPGWTDALYNLAVAQELAGRYSDAQATLKRYIQTDPGKKEAREAQDRIYALQAKAELASAPSPAVPTLDGAVFTSEDLESPGVVLVRRTIAIHEKNVTLTDHRLIPSGLEPRVRHCNLEGLSCRFPSEDLGGMQASRQLDITQDGKRAIVRLNWANGTTSLTEYRRQ